MAVAYLASNSNSGTAVLSLGSGNFDGSGSNRCVIACIAENDGVNDQLVSCNWDVASPQAMSEAVQRNQGSYYSLYMYYLAGQQSATDQVLASWGANTQDSAAIAGLSFTGVDQAAPIGNTQATSIGWGVSTGLDVTLTGVDSDEMCVGCMMTDTADAHTQDSGTTRITGENSGGSYPSHISVATQPGSTGGAMGCDNGALSSNKLYVAAVLQAAVAGGGGGELLQLQHVQNFDKNLTGGFIP